MSSMHEIEQDIPRFTLLPRQDTSLQSGHSCEAPRRLSTSTPLLHEEEEEDEVVVSSVSALNGNRCNLEPKLPISVFYSFVVFSFISLTLQTEKKERAMAVGSNESTYEVPLSLCDRNQG